MVDLQYCSWKQQTIHNFSSARQCLIVLFQECQLDLTTVAYAYVYFEKLILKVK